MESCVEVTSELIVSVVSFLAGFGARTVVEIIRARVKKWRG